MHKSNHCPLVSQHSIAPWSYQILNEVQTIDRGHLLVDMNTRCGYINLESLILLPLTVLWAAVKCCPDLMFDEHGYLTRTAMTVTIKLRNSLLAILLALLVGRWLIYSIGKAFGSYLKRKTATRRQSILKRVQVEEEAARSFYRRSQKAEDDDWEKIESYGAATSTNGSQADSDWEGIVGFFHPFWFVGLIDTRSECLLICRTVMLAAAVRECSGRPLEPHKSVGRRPSVSCILAITMLRSLPFSRA